MKRSKGFNHFMMKKDFHPQAPHNIERVWKAEQRKEAEEQKQINLQIQRVKEQEFMNNKY